MQLSSIRYNSSQLLLKNWSILKVSGVDRESFLQGQVTNDLSKLAIYNGHLTARLSRTGKLQSFFFIAKFVDCLYLLCPSQLTSVIVNDFQKYIIMDDVFLEKESKEIWLRFNSSFVNSSLLEFFFDFNFYGLNARFTTVRDPELPLTDELELEKLRVLNGWPKWNEDVNESNFINESFLNEIAISYKKGCFLGQETVSKIENNRGAAYYPMLLEIDCADDLTLFLNKDFYISTPDGERKAGILNYQIDRKIQVQLFRDFRVIGSMLKLKFNDKELIAKVIELPFYKNRSNEDLAKELYHRGIEIFQADNLESAMDYMRKALVFDPNLADAYEALGVMLGRIEKYNEAIGWMEQLMVVNPQSVMAHTNKSLFLMKLGKIEEAEAEKSLATIKSFAVFGEEAKLNKLLLEDKKKKEEDFLRREKMFLQVLEIDEEDTIALYGMADIYFHRKNFNSAISNLEKIILNDSKYSLAYLLLGKSFEAIEAIESAVEVYKVGIATASGKGDMIPANEMQSRLNQLIVNPRLC
jgi:folate-binding protein YgfZ